jgi:peptidoglycan hydrolase CwlO-like protein
VDAEILTEVSALRDQVEALQNQLNEAQERIDFTERLLTQGREVREGR